MSLTSARVNAIIDTDVIVFVVILVLNNRIPQKRRFRATGAISEYIRSLFTSRQEFQGIFKIPKQLISVKDKSSWEVKPQGQYFASVSPKDHLSCFGLILFLSEKCPNLEELCRQVQSPERELNKTVKVMDVNLF